MSNPILTILNRHYENCGAPPELSTRDGRYYGYFESESGDQWLFVYDNGTPEATLYGGDVDWKPYTITEGCRLPLVLNDRERQWLQACWLAARAGDGV